MVEVVFTEEDKKNLKTIVEEMPKLRLELESLKETLEILSCEGVLERFEQSKKDFAEGHVYTHEEMLKELGIDKEEV